MSGERSCNKNECINCTVLKRVFSQEAPQFLKILRRECSDLTEEDITPTCKPANTKGSTRIIWLVVRLPSGDERTYWAGPHICPASRDQNITPQEPSLTRNVIIAIRRFLPG